MNMHLRIRKEIPKRETRSGDATSGCFLFYLLIHHRFCSHFIKDTCVLFVFKQNGAGGENRQGWARLQSQLLSLNILLRVILKTVACWFNETLYLHKNHPNVRLVQGLAPPVPRKAKSSLKGRDLSRLKESPEQLSQLM